MTKSSKGSDYSSITLNAAIGFLGVLLFILIFALVTRLVYPRIVADRADPDPALISNVIQIEVLNGCGVPGLATAYTGTLRSYGFDVVETGNFDHFNIENTFVVSRSRNRENAKRVANAIGISEERVILEQSHEYYLDVTLVLGSDYESLNL